MYINVGRYSFNKIIDFILSQHSQVKQMHDIKTSVANEQTDYFMSQFRSQFSLAGWKASLPISKITYQNRKCENHICEEHIKFRQ